MKPRFGRELHDRPARIADRAASAAFLRTRRYSRNRAPGRGARNRRHDRSISLIPTPKTDARSFLAQAEEEFRSGTLGLFLPLRTSRAVNSAAPWDSRLRRCTGARNSATGSAFHSGGRDLPPKRPPRLSPSDSRRSAAQDSCLTILRGNIASQRVLEKIGMRHEGRSREHIHKWDRFIDLENYGLLAAEFRGRKVKS